MQRITRRAFLATGAAGLAVAACSGPVPVDLRKPAPTPIGLTRQPTPTSGPASRSTAVATTIPLVAGPADGYLVVAPSILHAGQSEAISFSLFKGDQATSDDVTVALSTNGHTVAQATTRVNGRGPVTLQLDPNLADGDYQLQVSSQKIQDQAPIRVESGTLVFLETDKPIYKPGQTVHFRLLALSPALRPATGQATLDVLDARGIKVFRATPTLDEFGLATVDLPLSSEPNLGVWKATATIGQRSAELDLQVEEYVLPKFDLKIVLKQSWALASDPVAGTITAEYVYGKPVDGEVDLTAYRYVGTWQQYAHLSQPIAGGKLAFQIPAVGYAAGSPANGGLGNVRLDVVVREQSTGYEEKVSELATIAAAPIHLTLIPESTTFKPSLPFSILVIAETPDKKPVDLAVQLNLSYQDSSFKQLKSDSPRVTTTHGLATLKLTPPTDAASILVSASAKDAAPATATLQAGFSPSGSFVHLESTTTGSLKVGDTTQFKVTSTRSATNVYYEVVARGQVVYSDVSPTGDIALTLTPAMAPAARLLVYQILPNSEVAADYLPIQVAGDYPQQVKLAVDRSEVKPGDPVGIQVQTEGPARVGLVAVDQSVFVLAENRLNLQQVFDALEKLYLKPQIELHDAQPFGLSGPIQLPGAKETFADAGVIVLTNRQVPAGKHLQPPGRPGALGIAGGGIAPVAVARDAAAPAAAPAAQNAASSASSGSLAEVQRVRQFFPETWIWESLTTDASGHGTLKLDAPDSITTWMLRAVALSKDKGLGIGETQLKVFQPFFLQVDLPYAAIRGEELPARVALYNYQATTEQFVVALEPASWFDLLDVRSKTVSVGPNAVGSASFNLRPTGLGVGSLKVSARSQTAADALVKDLLVEPEGIKRELVDNVVVTPGAQRMLDLSFPPDAVIGSPRAFVALTGNVLSQTIQGLDGLLQMPFGCGEQNMIGFAPDVFVSRYLKETGQLKPEVRAKAELLMLTGYQRELTYRRSDGSFSAFGQSDPEGSLFLTAFVLKTFAQANGLIFIDDGLLSAAQSWIHQHQNADGSFDPFGFVHHQDLLGGVNGKNALTAYLAIALKEAGDNTTASRAVTFLEGALGQISDAYGVATTACALALTQSGQAQRAHDKLMALARASDDGLSWGDAVVPLPMPIVVEPAPGAAVVHPPILPPRPPIQTSRIETTAYAALALLQMGDKLNASRAISWLAAQRNAQGGFGSTQDTVVALEAMTKAAVSSRADVDATVTLRAGAWSKDVRIAADNADVVQIVEVPIGSAIGSPSSGTPGGQPSPGLGALSAEARGKGQIMVQAVRRYNLLAPEASDQSAFQLDVSYDTTQVAVNDLLTITAALRFTPPEPLAAGMVVLDVSVPTGFEPVAATIADALKRQPKLKRYDVAGRKVIFYVQDLLPNEQLTISFQAKALYPVRAQPVSSQVYAYYRPDWRGETVGIAVSVES
jgi:CD109 antigen